MTTTERAAGLSPWTRGSRAAAIGLLKRVELLLLVIGLVTVPVLVAGVGTAETTRLATRMGPWLVPILVLGFVPHLLDTIGLLLCLPLDRARLGLAYTFAGRLAGEGVNTVLPTATVGGELVKVSILGRRAPLERVAAGVSLTYALDAYTIMVLAGVSLPIALPRLDLPVAARLTLAGLILAGLVGTYIFLGLVRSGLIGQVHEVARRLGIFRERLVGHGRGMTVVASHTVAASALFLTASTLWAAVEIGLVRYALFGEVQIADAIGIASLSAFLDAVFFFVPGQIGTREGGLAAITTLAGLGPSLGVAIGLVRRLNQVVWALLGYAVFAWIQRTAPIVTEPARGDDVASVPLA
jgi:hypothetical protein